MDGSGNRFSSPKSGKPSSLPKSSPTVDAGEADENYPISYDQMASKLHNPKKQLPLKHFMSPTVSAASKVATPRKRILTERNQMPFSDTSLRNSGNFDSRSFGSEPDSDEQEHTLVPDSSSSSKPYDPLTNYLSPRPKFLRYKPKRSHQILLRQENDGFHIKKGVSFDSQEPVVESTPCFQEVSVKQEDREEIEYKIEDDQGDDADEEIEEFEELGSRFNLKGVLKILLALVVLVLSTLYISCMEPPKPPSHTPQATIWVLKCGYQESRNHSFEAVNVKIFEGRRSGSFGQRERTSDYGCGEEFTVHEDDKKELVESTDEMGEVVEMQTEIVENVCDYELNEDRKELVESTDELGEVVEMQNGIVEDVCDYELNEAVSEQWQTAATANSEDVCEVELEEKEEVSVGLQQEETAEIDDQLEGIEREEKSESSQDFQMPSISEYSVGSVSSLQDGLVEAEYDNGRREEISVERAGKEVVENQMETVEGFMKNEVDIVMPEGLDKQNSEIATIISEEEENSVEVTMKTSKTVLTPVAVVVFVVITISAVLGSLLGRKKISVKQSLSGERPLHQSVPVEKINSIGPVVSSVEEEQVVEVESFENPSSLIRSTDEVSMEFYQSRAPTVELLGEFVVGSSQKSCSMKSKMVEIEASNNSGFREKGVQTKALVVVSSPVKSAASESSAMNFPSYGTFTTEMKIMKKKEGKDGEAKTVLTTPVRRSSRISNRAVMSP